MARDITAVQAIVLGLAIAGIAGGVVYYIGKKRHEPVPPHVIRKRIAKRLPPQHIHGHAPSPHPMMPPPPSAPPPQAPQYTQAPPSYGPPPSPPPSSPWPSMPQMPQMPSMPSMPHVPTWPDVQQSLQGTLEHWASQVPLHVDPGDLPPPPMPPPAAPSSHFNAPPQPITSVPWPGHPGVTIAPDYTKLARAIGLVRPGDAPLSVSDAQHYLNLLGSSLHEDGLFGPLTQAALHAFQVAHNLPATGKIDAMTSDALSYLAFSATTPSPPPMS